MSGDPWAHMKPVTCQCCERADDIARDLIEIAGWHKDFFGGLTCPECLQLTAPPTGTPPGESR